MLTALNTNTNKMKFIRRVYKTSSLPCFPPQLESGPGENPDMSSGREREKKRDSTTPWRIHEEFHMSSPVCFLLALPLSTAQGQVAHDMQSFSNQSVKILIKMMTWDHRDCSSSPLCTDLITTLAEGLREELLTLLHKDADWWPGTLTSSLFVNVNEEGPILNGGQLRAHPMLGVSSVMIHHLISHS